MKQREKLWTPGNWSVKNQFTVIIGSAGKLSGSLTTQYTGEIEAIVSEREANAQLISAAPELVEALERIVYKNDAGSVAQAKAALDKAYGESQ